MAEAARQSPRFPWDYDVPNTAFWNSLDYKVGRAFLSCYPASEISQMELDESLTRQQKLGRLQATLNQTLSVKERKAAPAQLRDVDFDSWARLQMAIGTMHHYRGDYEAEEKIIRNLYESEPVQPDGTKNMSALHGLSGLLEETGRYVEAEATARKVLPWLQGHARLGTADSPQALGSMRVLVKSIWMQARYAEAEEWIERCRLSIEKMGTGMFAKYQEDERAQFEAEVEVLKRRRM